MQDSAILKEVKTVFTNSYVTTFILNQMFASNVISGVRNGIRTIYDRSMVIHMMIIAKLMGLSSINEFKGVGLDKLIPCCKDVFYETKNDPKINWRRLLLRSAIDAYKSCNPGQASEDEV